MKRKTIRIGVFVFAILLSFTSFAMANQTRMVLLPFQVNGSDTEAVAGEINALLSNALKEQGFTVVSRGNEPPQSAGEARQIAETNNALYAVYGVYNQLGQGFTLDTRVVEVGSTINRPFYSEGERETQLAELVERVAAQFPIALSNKEGIVNIRIDGAQVLDINRVLAVVKSQVGSVANAELMDSDIRAIWDMGYFSDVSARIEDSPNGIGQVLVFDVIEKPRISSIKINGPRDVKQEDILAAMNSATGTILNEKVLVDDLQVIKELYHKEGYYHAEINYAVEDPGLGTGAVLILNVTPGNKLYIKEVNVNGVDRQMQLQLRKYMKLRPRGVFSFFTKTGIIEEEFLQRDTDAIKSFLVDSGYLEATVEPPTVAYATDGIIIDFNVETGGRYSLGEVGFVGDLIEDEASLYERIGLDDVKAKTGFFSLETMQEDIEILKNTYTDFGYAYADIGVNTPLNRELATVDVLYQLDPKEKVFLRNIFIEGNTETRDNVILRELRIADGQQYDGAKIRRSIERLEKLQFFEEVNVDLIPTGTPGEVDLKISVKEASTGVISLGLGYSTYDDFGVSASINQRNFLGRGYNIGVNGYISGKTLSMRGSFVNPRINDTDLGFFGSLYAEDQEWPDYDRRTVGTQMGLMYPLGEYSSISAAYRLEFYTLEEVAEFASTSIKSYEGENIASVASLTFSRDTTDHPLAPTKGTKQSVVFEYGGGILGGSDDFYKLTASYGAYLELYDRHVIHARGTAGAVFENGNDPIPSFERFYIGGINTLRGYDYEDVSPQDPRTSESIGATNVFYGTAEYIWLVNQEYKIYLVPFFDIATVYDEEYQGFGDNNYYSTGIEVRWDSPFGALRFAYGYPLTDNVDGENIDGRFEFSMGRAF